MSLDIFEDVCSFSDIVSAQVHELLHAQELLSNLQLSANAALQQQLKYVRPQQ